MTCPEGRRCSWCGPCARRKRAKELEVVERREVADAVPEHVVDFDSGAWDDDPLPELEGFVEPLRVNLVSAARIR